MHHWKCWELVGSMACLVHAIKLEHGLQPVWSRLRGLDSPDSPALTSHPFPIGKHADPVNPHSSTGMLQDATLPAPAPWMPPWPQVAHQRTETAAVQLREASPFIPKIPKTQEWPSSSPGLWVGFPFRAQATWYYSTEKEEHGPFWGWCLNWSLPNKRERGQDLPFVTDVACAGALPTGCVLSVALRGQHH